MLPGGEGQGEGEPWATLAAGSGQTTVAPLATFDPTLLLNGIYELRLTATDLVGRTATTDPMTLVVERNMKVGHFTVSFNDLTIPVAGIPIQVTRTYDSRDRRMGDFGVGWTLDLKNIRLQKNRHLGLAWDQTSTGGLFPSYCIATAKPRVVTITFPDGRVHKFQASAVNINTRSSCQALLPMDYPTMVFNPVGGNTYGTLIPLSEIDGESVVDDQLVFPSPIPGRNDLISFERLVNPPPGPADIILFNPDLFEFVSQEGYRYILSETNGLRSVTDPNGNTLTIATNGITWTNTHGGAGLSVAFRRDGLGRITNIVDALGHTMTYSYDTNGNLITFTDRAGITNGFTYDGKHQLLTLADARGTAAMGNEYNAEGRLTRQTDSLGGTFSYAYDIPNRVVAVTNRIGSTTVQEYDDDGNLVRATAAHGGVTTCTYDDAGRRISRTNPLGHTSRYLYAETNGALIAAVNPLGRTNTFTYSAAGQIVRATETDGTPLYTAYDAANKATNVVDTLGHATLYAYNAQGKAIYSRNALGHEVHSDYDTFGNLLRSTNALGHVAEYAYDANNNLVCQVLTRTVSGSPQRLTNSWQYDSLNRVTNAIAADGSSHRSVYDASGHLMAVIDELGRATHHEYDSMGRLVRTVFPDGSSEGIAYDAEDRKVAITNRIGQVTQIIYDGLNRLVATVQPDGTGSTNFYDAAGRVIAMTDARGNPSFYGRDALGRLTSTTNALGEVNSFTYDSRGNQIISTDALGRTTTNVFDLANRLVQVLFPDGTRQSTDFDALGRKFAETDANTNTTWFAYDALGRLTAVTNALDHVTRYEYNEIGEQTAQIDAENRTTRYEYDTRGRRVSRILPLGQADFAVYDAVGNMLSYLDFNQNLTTFAHDALNRLLQKTPDPRLGEPSIQFGYNALGLRTNMVDASGATTYRYDERNRLVEKCNPQGTLSYLYDASGNVTNIQSSNANGVALGYDYDALNRLSAVHDARLGRTDYAYDSVGNLQGYALPNGVTTTHAYDALNRLTNLTTLNPQLSALNQFSYRLDPSGHRLAAQELGGRAINYAYDVLYRLTSETVSSAPAPQNGLVAYQYDKVGNRLARNSSLPGILAGSYAYDANDRLAGDSYDANGNTRAATLRANTTGPATPVNDHYDFENRLVNRNGGQLTVVYDGDGQRVRKTVGGVTTHYLVDDLNPTGYAQVVEELTSTGGAPVVARTYAWGHALLAQDQLRDTGTNFVWQAAFYGTDGQGSVRYLTDSTGNVTDTFDYDAFGNLLARTGTTANNYLYQGEQFDHDLGLYYLRARYADPDRGRFWTQDSFEGFGSDPASLHKYTFNHNDPVNRRDPSGHFSLTESQMVTALAPMVRGAALSLQQSLLTCRLQSALLAGGIAGGISGTVGGIISEIAQLVTTGTIDGDQVLKDALKAGGEGFLAGLAAGFNPFTAWAYVGYSNINAGLNLFNVWNDPEAGPWSKGLAIVEQVTALVPVLAPSLVKKLQEMLQILCFPAGTEIATAEGQKPIEELAEGDLVWAQSDKTGEIKLQRVKQVFANVGAALVVLHCGTNTLEATPEHPLWVVNQGWKTAQQVKIGDELWTRSGYRMAVTGVGHKQGQFTVFNFEVENFHSYFVGKDELLGHNDCKWRMFEDKVRSLYTRQSLRSRQFVDNAGTVRTADSVAVINGRNVAVEAKFTDDWAGSIYNPSSSIGNAPFALEAQQEMIEQAKRYVNAFGEAVYHSNSKQLIEHYTHVFRENGISNVRFVFTSSP